MWIDTSLWIPIAKTGDKGVDRMAVRKGGYNDLTFTNRIFTRKREQDAEQEWMVKRRAATEVWAGCVATLQHLEK